MSDTKEEIIKKLQSLKRYSISGGYGTSEGEVVMDEWKEGDVVKWKDIESILADAMMEARKPKQ